MSEDLPNTDSLIGLTVDQGRYEIVKLIGEGGMGRVFQARQVSMNRMVALKILRAQLASDEQLLARFQQEAMSVSRLRHPNTITVYDYGKTEDGYLFMAMELLGGRSLFGLLRHEKRIALSRALHIMEQVCGAVGEAHKMGIVHRDLKPENIQIDEVASDPDYAKVLDFGIAKIIHGDGDTVGGKTLTMAGAIFGTPHYMSPEQVHGLRVDHRTDVYSLGVILYEILTGVPPFDGATPMAVMMAQASKPPPDIRDFEGAEVTDTIAELINHCLVKERDDRCDSVPDLLERIRAAQYEIGDMSSTSARAYASSGLHRIDDNGERRNSRPPSGRQQPQPRPTPAPSIDTQADSNRTPELTGALATLPPGADDDLTIAGGGAAKWVSLALLCVALGGGLYLWQSGPGDGDGQSAAAGGAEGGEPVRVKVASRAIAFEVATTPAGADVFKDDEKLGVTPLEYKVPEGQTHTLTVKLADHQDHDLELKGEGEESQNIHIPLARAAIAKAWLSIGSDPDGADVFLAEEKIGTTPFDWEPAVGDQPAELKFTKDGYKEVIEKVPLEARGDDPVSLTIAMPARPRVSGASGKKPRWRRKPKPSANPEDAPGPAVEPKPKQLEVKPKRPEPRPKKPEPKPKKPYEKL